MNERTVFPETIQSPEDAERAALKERIVTCLKEKGPQDEESQRLMIEWWNKAEAQRATSRERRTGIKWHIDSSDFYIVSGDLEEAMRILLQANDELVQNADSSYEDSDEGWSDDLIDLVDEKIRTLEKDSPGLRNKILAEMYS